MKHGTGVQGSLGLARQSLRVPLTSTAAGLQLVLAKPASSSPHLWKLLIPVASLCPVIQKLLHSFDANRFFFYYLIFVLANFVFWNFSIMFGFVLRIYAATGIVRR